MKPDPIMVFQRAVALYQAFTGFHFDTLEGELARMRFKRVLRRDVPGHHSTVYERAISRAEAIVRRAESRR